MNSKHDACFLFQRVYFCSTFSWNKRPATTLINPWCFRPCKTTWKDFSTVQHSDEGVLCLISAPLEVRLQWSDRYYNAALIVTPVLGSVAASSPTGTLA